MDLSGKTVVYVGGFGGIGLETSKHLLQKHLKHLIILDKADNVEAMAELKTLAADCVVHFYKFDATMDKSAMQQIFDEILKAVEYIDIFIYGAGICNDKLPELTLQVNLAGLVNSIAIILPHMDKRSGGRGGMIVSVASTAGLVPVPSVPIYAATKAAVVSITRSLSSDVIYAQTNVSFMVICPGATRTSIMNDIPSFLGLEPDFNELLKVMPTQSAEVCGRNLVAAIEKGENGAIWLLNLDKMDLVIPTQFQTIPE